MRRHRGSVPGREPHGPRRVHLDNRFAGDICTFPGNSTQVPSLEIMRTRLTHLGSLALLCLVSASCATVGANPDEPTTLSLTRPDGGSVVCTRPPEAWLDSQGGVGVAAALPTIVQDLVTAGGGTARTTVKPSGGGPPAGGAGTGDSSSRGADASRATPGASKAATGATGKSGDLLDAVVQSAPNPQALNVLDYRLCLAYGKGILSRDVYVQWLLDVRPRAFKAVRHARDGS